MTERCDTGVLVVQVQGAATSRLLSLTFGFISSSSNEQVQQVRKGGKTVVRRIQRVINIHDDNMLYFASAQAPHEFTYACRTT